MKKTILATSVLASTALLTPQLTLAKDLRIDGFASIYAGQVMDEDELGGKEFRGYADDSINFQQNTKIGLQFMGDIQDGLTATAQFFGQGRDDFDPKVTWAFMKYQLNDTFNIKAGRQRVPYFLFSDFLQVGYAYTWAEPPAEVYDLGGFENVDGINLEMQSELADWSSRLNLLFGRTDTELDFDGSSVQLSSKNFTGVTWNMSRDWFTFQAIYSKSKASLSAYNDTANGIDQFTGGTISDEDLGFLTMDESDSDYAGIGISADWGDWLAAAEHTWIKLEDNPAAYDRKAWYLFGGYRWQKYTFGLTYAHFENPNNPDTIAALEDNNVEATLNGIIHPLSPADSFTKMVAGQMLEAIPSLYRAGKESKSYTATVRYDFHPSAAFKVEYVKEDADYDMDNGSPVTNLKPALVRMGVDLVF